jgi:glycosyltransferase involved in cell wall biosynthesis
MPQLKLMFCTMSTGILGGREKVFADKVNYLYHTKNYDLYIVTTNQGGSENFYSIDLCKEKQFDLNVDYHDIELLNPVKRLMARRKLRQIHQQKLSEIIAQVMPDVIVINSTDELFFLNKIKGKAKLIFEEHTGFRFSRKMEINHIYTGFNMYLRLIRWKLLDSKIEKKLKNFDKIICLTNAARKMHDCSIHSKIEVLGNPLSSCFENYQFATKKKHIIAVGRLSFEKRYDMLLKACHLIIDKCDGWTFHLYGDGPELDDLKMQANSLGISEIFFFHPAQEDILSIYQEASICVITSLFESYSMVITEAMSQEVACISVKCPTGPMELIDNGKTGILLDDSDVIKLSNAILHLINNPDLRNEIGINARKSVRHCYLKPIMHQYQNILMELALSSRK